MTAPLALEAVPGGWRMQLNGDWSLAAMPQIEARLKSLPATAHGTLSCDWSDAEAPGLGPVWALLLRLAESAPQPSGVRHTGGPPHFPVQWAREPSISFLFTADVTRAKLEAAGFRVVTWQDTTPEALESAAKRAGNATTTPPPLGTHLILGDDWQAMFKNSARNLGEHRTELFNAVLEPAA